MQVLLEDCFETLDIAKFLEKKVSGIRLSAKGGIQKSAMFPMEKLFFQSPGSKNGKHFCKTESELQGSKFFL